MKNSLIEELKKTFSQLSDFVKLEYTYLTLTAAEKMTLIAGAVAVSAVIFIFGSMMLMLLLLALAEFFKEFLAPVYAYLCSAGVFAVLIILVCLLRRPLILNPISRFLTKLMLGKKIDNK